jgi:hypothetical protein
MAGAPRHRFWRKTNLIEAGMTESGTLYLAAPSVMELGVGIRGRLRPVSWPRSGYCRLRHESHVQLLPRMRLLIVGQGSTRKEPWTSIALASCPVQYDNYDESPGVFGI